MWISRCRRLVKSFRSNAPKYPLNNGVSIVQNLVVKLSNTSTMLFPSVAKTLSKCESLTISQDNVSEWSDISTRETIEKTKDLTMIYKTLDRKLNTIKEKQH
jgi:hypothetical protein